mmetsp:Transcript_6942/g.19584  ORF Transcript_6942/g.19584 Transcript_6942/m.19584 type:complete len:435 (-) Transcript_6942:199-1503(-)
MSVGLRELEVQECVLDADAGRRQVTHRGFHVGLAVGRCACALRVEGRLAAEDAAASAGDAAAEGSRGGVEVFARGWRLRQGGWPNNCGANGTGTGAHKGLHRPWRQLDLVHGAAAVRRRPRPLLVGKHVLGPQGATDEDRRRLEATEGVQPNRTGRLKRAGVSRQAALAACVRLWRQHHEARLRHRQRHIRALHQSILNVDHALEVHGCRGAALAARATLPVFLVDDRVSLKVVLRMGKIAERALAAFSKCVKPAHLGLEELGPRRLAFGGSSIVAALRAGHRGERHRHLELSVKAARRGRRWRRGRRRRRQQQRRARRQSRGRGHGPVPAAVLLLWRQRHGQAARARQGARLEPLAPESVRSTCAAEIRLELAGGVGEVAGVALAAPAKEVEGAHFRLQEFVLRCRGPARPSWLLRLLLEGVCRRHGPRQHPL